MQAPQKNKGRLFGVPWVANLTRYFFGEKGLGF